jgi:hypothetical protein
MVATALPSSCEQLAPFVRVTAAHVFGKTGVFCDGLMFGW